MCNVQNQVNEVSEDLSNSEMLKIKEILEIRKSFLIYELDLAAYILNPGIKCGRIKRRKRCWLELYFGSMQMESELVSCCIQILFLDGRECAQAKLFSKLLYEFSNFDQAQPIVNITGNHTPQ